MDAHLRRFTAASVWEQRIIKVLVCLTGSRCDSLTFEFGVLVEDDSLESYGVLCLLGLSGEVNKGIVHHQSQVISNLVQCGIDSSSHLALYHTHVNRLLHNSVIV